MLFFTAIICGYSFIQQVEEVGLGFLMERMSRIGSQCIPAFKLGIQGIVHANESPPDFHMQQAGNLTDQRLQDGGDQIDRFIFVNALFKRVQYNMLNHMNPPCEKTGTVASPGFILQITQRLPRSPQLRFPAERGWTGRCACSQRQHR